MIDLWVRPGYEPEGVCNMAWQVRIGSLRHYCDNAARMVVRIADDEDEHLSCNECVLEIVKRGLLQLEDRRAV